MIIRPLKRDDFAILKQCASQARGMTSLPKNEMILKTLMENSLSSFSLPVDKPKDEYYLFSLVEPSEDSVCGISALRATCGYGHTRYFYRIQEKKLKLVSLEQGPSELCSLFLLPSYRKGGWGKLLSLSRLHFIAAFPQRFKSDIMAEMRGFIDESKKSPFWESMGHKKIDITHEEAEEKIAEQSPEVEIFLYRDPLPLSSLSPDAQKALGKTHPNTIPALEMLKREGFKWRQFIDVVDGGPQIYGITQELRSIKQSEELTLKEIGPIQEEGPLFLVSNNQLHFRATFARVKRWPSFQACLSPETASNLALKVGDTFRVSSLYR